MKARNNNTLSLKLLFLATTLFICFNISFAQPGLPQRTLTVTPTQSIHFGTICVTSGAGGTVTMGYNGTRTSSGSVYLLSIAPIAQPAIFEIKLCPGRTVIITFDATTNLTGSNGGTLVMDIGPTEKGPNGCRFSTNNDCNFITTLRVGGTLHVPGNAIQGTYTGSFAITFNQE